MLTRCQILTILILNAVVGVTQESSAEAAIALRQRLNETVDQLDTLRKDHNELEVKFEAQSKELTIAKSDCEPLPHFFLCCLTLSDT